MNNLNLKVLIIGTVFPEPNSSAAGGRMMQLINLFLEQNCHVTFASAAADSDYMFDLENIGVRKERIKLNHSSFDDFIKNLQPSIVLFDRFMIEEQFGWRVAANCSSALRILDTEDLHCLRAARQMVWKENRSFDNSDLFSDIAKREIASILRCDLSLIISDFEMNLLLNIFKISEDLLLYLPFLLDPISDELTKDWPTFENRNDFVFIGNFYHEPNWNAVLYLKEQIFPAIKKLMPEAKIKIYGAYASQKVLSLHNEKDGFLIMGRAEQSKIVIEQARVLLAPIRFGAGIKGKLVEAMMFGTPSITTSIGSEGIEIDGKWNGFIENDIVMFAKSAVILYNDRKLWLQAQENGRELFNLRYTNYDYKKGLLKRIIDLIETLKNHRQNNFLGAMLQHHQFMGTKYMSMWIEAKNKIQ